MFQQTLIIIKPDGMAGGFSDEIIRRYQEAGLEVVKRKEMVAPLSIVEKHYPMDPDYLKSIGEKTIAAGQAVTSAEDQGRKVVTWLRKFITSGPIVVLLLEGEDAVGLARKVTGFTDPSTAEKGTIRGDLGTDNILDANREQRPVYNLIHASGSPDEAKKEIKLWFGEGTFVCDTIKLMQKGFAPILILIIVVALLSVGGYLYYQKQNKVTTPLSQQNVQSNQAVSQNPLDKTLTDHTIPILKDYDPKSFGRNLWLYTNDLKQGTQLTSNHEIMGLYSKSPDNKNIIVSTINRVPGDNNLHERISIVNIDTKNITRLFSSYNSTTIVSNVGWLDNNRIIYALGRQIKVYTISSGSEEVLIDAGKNITDSTIVMFNISPDKKWLIYYYLGSGEGDPPQQNKNTYSINLENKKEARLFSGAYYQTLNNNFVIYSKTLGSKVQVWKVDFSGAKEELITTLPKGELINVTSDDSGNKLVYQVRSYSLNSGTAELYLYNVDTKTSQLFFKADTGDGIRDPRISQDGDTVLFSAALDKNVPLKFTIVKFDLQTSMQVTLNNDSEPSSSTIIIY